MFGIDLPVLWFILVAFLFAGYFLLEGFDFGIGILLPILGRDEARRSAMLRTIGPVWDGNEVWLITAGGALFAAFPEWYATMFSGFYLPLFLILLALIVRIVGLEWRKKVDDPVAAPLRRRDHHLGPAIEVVPTGDRRRQDDLRRTAQLSCHCTLLLI